VAALLAAAFFVFKDVNIAELFNKKTVPPIVVIDSVRIIEGTVSKIMEIKKHTPDYDSTGEVERVNAAVDAIVQRFAAQGTIVLQKGGGFVAIPYWLDITESVGKEVGIDVNQKIKL
jgi:hypothetical protein